ncbi:MAG: hypothetical protein RBU36_17425, partial [Thermoanaerobaculia bacterium]|nr:hypothetical protein [Thermoanaerobaculia bacterium]
MKSWICPAVLARPWNSSRSSRSTVTSKTSSLPSKERSTLGKTLLSNVTWPSQSNQGRSTPSQSPERLPIHENRAFLNHSSGEAASSTYSPSLDPVNHGEAVRGSETVFPGLSCASVVWPDLRGL